jgi:hypothetical protein
MTHPREMNLPTREIHEAYEELYQAAQRLEQEPDHELLNAAYWDASDHYRRLMRHYREGTAQ